MTRGRVGSSGFMAGTCAANSSRDSWWISLLTFGEGYHNYHHMYQSDYRNGANWYDFDPSKWLIWALSKIGLAYDLHRPASNTSRSSSKTFADNFPFAPVALHRPGELPFRKRSGKLRSSLLVAIPRSLLERKFVFFKLNILQFPNPPKTDPAP